MLSIRKICMWICAETRTVLEPEIRLATDKEELGHSTSVQPVPMHLGLNNCQVIPGMVPDMVPRRHSVYY